MYRNLNSSAIIKEWLYTPLEREDLILQLADRLRLFESQPLGSLFHGADHWWGTAKEELNVIRWLRKEFLDTLLAPYQHSQDHLAHTVIISGVTKPTPPSHFSGGLFRT
jgi:hypothetical protein